MVNVIFLGLVSFFADISSEKVYPIIPLYLTSVFGATPAIVGLIEGIAESVASLLKVFSGYITDKYKGKRSDKAGNTKLNQKAKTYIFYTEKLMDAFTCAAELVAIILYFKVNHMIKNNY
ncbi:MAG: hypothetical protein PHH84_07105 [Oscillospiraceae bacterium]|nr:hypothetical protein [Oscillospiraceae bacterium]MDD4413323.1 hypothetical protein [Oscillospiraceae bacterium]